MIQKLNTTLISKKIAERKQTQEEFAEEIGIDRSTLSYWMNGKRMPNPENLQKLADELDLDVDELIKMNSASISVESP